MKTLLRGGPYDGEITDTSRETFAIGYVTEIEDKATGKVTQQSEVKYVNTSQHEHHPCKKKGRVRVFEYQPTGASKDG